MFGCARIGRGTASAVPLDQERNRGFSPRGTQAMARRLRKRTIGTLLIAVAAFIAFAYGESPASQRYLLGPTPAPSGNQAADAFAADDRAMGAGLAPFVYALVPGLISFAFGVAFATTDVRRFAKDGLVIT